LGSGDLFADASMPDEYQPTEATLMWGRVLDFLDRVAIDRSDRWR
jgi:hypothetical protein